MARVCLTKLKQNINCLKLYYLHVVSRSFSCIKEWRKKSFFSFIEIYIFFRAVAIKYSCGWRWWSLLPPLLHPTNEWMLKELLNFLSTQIIKAKQIKIKIREQKHPSPGSSSQNMLILQIGHGVKPINIARRKILFSYCYNVVNCMYAWVIIRLLPIQSVRILKSSWFIYYFICRIS